MTRIHASAGTNIKSSAISPQGVRKSRKGSTYSFCIERTTALEKGADDVERLIMKERLSVGRNMNATARKKQDCRRCRCPSFDPNSSIEPHVCTDLFSDAILSDPSTTSLGLKSGIAP
jgi:hypothetical protein